VGDPVIVLESARDQLQKLAPLAQELNTASDAFTEELRTIEAELVKLNLGIEVTVNAPLGSAYNAIRFGRKRNGDWALLATALLATRTGGPLPLGPVPEMIPLLEAPRDVRIAAADHIEALLSLIAAEAKKKIDSLNKAIDK